MDVWEFFFSFLVFAFCVFTVHGPTGQSEVSDPGRSYQQTETRKLRKAGWLGGNILFIALYFEFERNWNCKPLSP